MPRLLLIWLALSAVAPLPAGEPAAVLVFGGTGRLGAPIVRELAAAGHDVTVFARPSSDRGRLAGLDVGWVTGDLVDADSVRRALAGRSFDIVIDASSRGASREPFYDTAMRNLLAALEPAGVRQFILHGSVGAGDNMQHFPGMFERMAGVMRAKGEAERLLKASGIPWTIIRNGIVRPDGTPATGRARLSTDDTLLSAVTREDLALLTLQCLDNPDCLGRTFHAVDDSAR